MPFFIRINCIFLFSCSILLISFKFVILVVALLIEIVIVVIGVTAYWYVFLDGVDVSVFAVDNDNGKNELVHDLIILSGFLFEFIFSMYSKRFQSFKSSSLLFISLNTCNNSLLASFIIVVPFYKFNVILYTFTYINIIMFLYHNLFKYFRYVTSKHCVISFPRFLPRNIH